MKNVLEITNLKIGFGINDTNTTNVVHDLNLSINEKEIIGLVGESGSGKSVTCLAALQLAGSLAKVSGSVAFKGKSLLDLSEKDIAEIRGNDIAMIFQDPMSSLNPVKSLRSQIYEAIQLNNHHYANANKSLLEIEAIRLLSEVGIPDPKHRLESYPHELSGGMSQRAMIAIMLAGSPSLLIADEPTTALDVTIQAQILRLLKKLRNTHKMSIVLITHDLGVVAQTCDRIAVMYCGRIVESGSVIEVFKNPKHPYTKGLLNSRPKNVSNQILTPIEGIVPMPNNLPKGCAFAPRCKQAIQNCLDFIPKFTIENEHGVACFNPVSTKKELDKEGCLNE